MCIATNAAKARRPADPTHTTILRSRYEADLVRRFRAIALLIRQSILDNDALGLRPRLIAMAIAPMQPRFDFPTSADKVDRFMAWLREQADAGLLSIISRDGPTIVAREAWQNVYVQSAYQKGMVDARRELVRSGQIDPIAVESEAFTAFGGAFNAPIHAEALGLLFTRNFEELRGITDAMSQAIARELAQGLADGVGADVLARRLVKQVDGVGIRRARLLARTEVIRAHADATLNTYESYGLQIVGLMAEIIAAHDGRVCPICLDWERRTAEKPLPIAQARGLLPLHPQCRCSWIPAGVGENRAKRVARANAPAAVAA